MYMVHVVIAVFSSSRLPTSNLALDNIHYAFVKLFSFVIRSSTTITISTSTCSTGVLSPKYNKLRCLTCVNTVL